MVDPVDAKQHMYALINPDPLRQVTVRSLAEQAGCARGVIGDLRTGRLTVVSYRIACSIAASLGMRLEELFYDTHRRFGDHKK